MGNQQCKNVAAAAGQRRQEGDFLGGEILLHTFRCAPRLRLLKSFASEGYLAGEVVSGAPAT